MQALNQGESGEKAKEEPMDINDAQVSLGSDIVIERPTTDNQIEETVDLTKKSPVASSSERKRVLINYLIFLLIRSWNELEICRCLRQHELLTH